MFSYSKKSRSYLYYPKFL
nr:unnamed protein product [Callosobruchus chinensis]